MVRPKQPARTRLLHATGSSNGRPPLVAACDGRRSFLSDDRFDRGDGPEPACAERPSAGRATGGASRDGLGVLTPALLLRQERGHQAGPDRGFRCGRAPTAWSRALTTLLTPGSPEAECRPPGGRLRTRPIPDWELGSPGAFDPREESGRYGLLIMRSAADGRRQPHGVRIRRVRLRGPTWLGAVPAPSHRTAPSAVLAPRRCGRPPNPDCRLPIRPAPVAAEILRWT